MSYPPARFDDAIARIGGEMLGDAHSPRWPADRHLACFRLAPQSDQKPGIVRGFQARAPFPLADERTAGQFDLDASTDGVAVADRADQAKPHPVVGRRGVVPEQGRCPILVIDDDIEIAVVVQVAEGRPAARRDGSSKYGPASRVASRNRSPEVVMQQGGMSVGAVVPQELKVVVHVAVGDEAIRPAVVVEIRQGTAPADPGRAVGGHPAGRRPVFEHPVPQVHVERSWARSSSW